MYIFQFETSFVNLNPLARNSGSASAPTIYFIYMGQPIWDPYGTRLHCPYGSPNGTHIGPIQIASWVMTYLETIKSQNGQLYPEDPFSHGAAHIIRDFFWKLMAFSGGVGGGGGGLGPVLALCGIGQNERQLF